MRIILFWAIVLPNFIGCLAADGSNNLRNKPQICTDMASPYIIKVTITSPYILPQNLAFSLNGKIVYIDECNPGANSFFSRIEVITGRNQAILYFELKGEELNKYFPGNFRNPASNLINLIIYDRDKCTDPPSQYQEISDIRVSWKPVYINGEHCGLTSYRGESRIDL